MSCNSKTGTLILLIGNSGSGKDSLIQWVSDHWPHDRIPPIIPVRVITRPPSPETEAYQSISEEKFQALSKLNAFSLQWKSYGIYYGVKAEIEDYLTQGRSVLVNVSRQIVEDARSRLPRVCVIFVKVPLQITQERIRARGREHGEDLERRLERARNNQEFPTADYQIDNSGDLATAGDQLLKVLFTVLE
jgi:phosphonate metabolism protein PhnN/1,5-bisphosphokinase (PRPP-forming)